MNLSSGDVLSVNLETTVLFDADVSLVDPEGLKVVSSAGGIKDLMVQKTGSYRLLVRGSGEGGFVLAATDRSFAIASSIQVDAVPTTAVIDNPAEEHIYEFSTTQPTVVDLDVRAINHELLTPEIILLGPQGRRVAAAASPATLTSVLVNGEYRVIVRSTGEHGGQGGYVLGISTADPALIIPTPDASIAFGQAVNGSIGSLGEDLQFSLEVSALDVGQPVSIVHSAVPDASTGYYASQLSFMHLTARCLRVVPAATTPMHWRSTTLSYRSPVLTPSACSRVATTPPAVSPSESAISPSRRPIRCPPSTRPSVERGTARGRG